MKTCLLTFAVFLVMLGLIIANAVYIQKTVDKLSAKLETVVQREERAQPISELLALWKKEKQWVQISVPHTKIDTVTDLLNALTVYAENNDMIEFQKTAALLQTALFELCTLEKPTVFNIL